MAFRKSSSSVPETGFPQWRVEYESALQETDRKTLFKRIEVAEAAILARRDILTRVLTASLNGRKSRCPGQAAQSEEGSLEVLVIGSAFHEKTLSHHFSTENL